MITVNYLTFAEVNKIIKPTGAQLGFEDALKISFGGNTYITKAGELIDDYIVRGEHQYLVNHNFADKLSINYEADDKATQSQCLNLKSSMENWLVKKAEWYWMRQSALDDITSDNKTVTQSSSSSETSNTGSSETTTDQDTGGTNESTTDTQGGADKKYFDTPETTADYSTGLNVHMTNLAKDKTWDYSKTSGTTSGTLDSKVTGTNSSSGSASGSGTTTTTSPTATLRFDRMSEIIWPLFEDFKKRWTLDACLLGEGF